MWGRGDMAGIITVLGGTGFLGRRIVGRLHEAGIDLRIGSRHPDRSQRLFGGDTDLLQSIGVDIHNEGSLQKAITGADAIVNAVRLYVEHGLETFRSVHVDAARRVARLARGGRRSVFGVYLRHRLRSSLIVETH